MAAMVGALINHAAQTMPRPQRILKFAEREG